MDKKAIKSRADRASLDRKIAPNDQSTISPLGSQMTLADTTPMPRILITLGDPAGVGPEVVALALSSFQIPPGFEIDVIGDANAGTPGKPDQKSAAAALDALHESVRQLKNGSAAGVVTGPVSKQGLQSLGFPFPGQTEFFADAFGVTNFGMLLTGATLSVGLATIHEPISKVAELLNESKILQIGLLMADFLQRRGIEHPRIAVAGLNPHAGENGIGYGGASESSSFCGIQPLNGRSDDSGFLVTERAIFSGVRVEANHRLKPLPEDQDHSKREIANPEPAP